MQETVFDNEDVEGSIDSFFDESREENLSDNEEIEDSTDSVFDESREENFSNNEELEDYTNLIFDKKLELRDLIEQYEEIQINLQDIADKISKLEETITYYENLM